MYANVWGRMPDMSGVDLLDSRLGSESGYEVEWVAAFGKLCFSYAFDWNFCCSQNTCGLVKLRHTGCNTRFRKVRHFGYRASVSCIWHQLKAASQSRKRELLTNNSQGPLSRGWMHNHILVLRPVWAWGWWCDRITIEYQWCKTPRGVWGHAPRENFEI
jgi:hypothetical protein